jgi:hypothetical protein
VDFFRAIDTAPVAAGGPRLNEEESPLPPMVTGTPGNLQDADVRAGAEDGVRRGSGEL